MRGSVIGGKEEIGGIKRAKYEDSSLVILIKAAGANNASCFRELFQSDIKVRDIKAPVAHKDQEVTRTSPECIEYPVIVL